MTKHIWNIINKKESIWVRWINRYKLQGNNFWDIRAESGASWSWSNILKNRETIRHHCWSTIGDGTQTSVWFDMWHPLSPLGEIVTKREIHRAGLDLETKVADIIKEGRWKWPVEWRERFACLYDFEPPRLWVDKQDATEWKANNGQLVVFSTSQAFVDICGASPEMSWHKMIWFTQNIPRHAFILWLAVKERLLTQDRLWRWERNTDNLKCAFCDSQRDSHAHLFFECEFPNRIWSEVKKIADLGRPPAVWSECVHYLGALPTNPSIKSIIWRLLLGATVYFIWQEKNLRLFQNGKRKWEEVFELIKEEVKLRLWGLKIRDTKGSIEASKIWGFEVIRKPATTIQQ
ncbi:uncharacterized protein LOC143632543 [Bidens hawaiensis]|uniref:uncharacterized protein LOC143632543 n=1 Tax=Bidens hawaiensis TaxID=980011 RepID=UPI00404AA5C8